MVNTLGYNAELFFLVRITNRLAVLNRESKQLEKLQNTYLSEYTYIYIYIYIFYLLIAGQKVRSTENFLQIRFWKTITVFSIHIAWQVNQNKLIKRTEDR